MKALIGYQGSPTDEIYLALLSKATGAKVLVYSSLEKRGGSTLLTLLYGIVSNEQ